MNSIIQAVLTLIEAILPNITVSGTVQKIIQTLIAILPSVIQEAEDLVPVVKNIIAALAANPATTQDQLTQLQELDANTDAGYEAALAAAQAEDAAT